MADGATNNPTNAVFTGTRLAMTSPRNNLNPSLIGENASYYHGKKKTLRMNRMPKWEAALQMRCIFTAIHGKNAVNWVGT
jgi:hypothetical protein